MRTTFLLAGIFAATMLTPALTVSASSDVAEVEAPETEQHAIIQRLDPVTGTVFAGGVNYHLQPTTRFWIDNQPVLRSQLTPDMVGLRMGFSAYQDESRWLITIMHVKQSEGRGLPAGDKQ